MLMVYIPFHSVPPHTIFRWQRICMYVTTSSYFYVRIYNAFFSRDLLSWHKICQSIHTATFCRSGAKLILNPEPEQDGNCIVFYSSLSLFLLCLYLNRFLQISSRFLYNMSKIFLHYSSTYYTFLHVFFVKIRFSGIIFQLFIPNLATPLR